MRAKKLGIVRFLGTNCDRDVWQAAELAKLNPEWLWYQDQFDPKDYKALVIPGGFSYGDYLRCGALAAKAPVMNSVRKAAELGAPILGICNGFQILCDSGLLPGALVQNEGLRFVDKWVDLNLASACEYWASDKLPQVNLPVAHGEGRYYAEDDQVNLLFDNDQVWWTYGDNPNGSVADIAGVTNKEKNVAGLMPHPERAVAQWMGADCGLWFFKSLV